MFTINKTKMSISESMQEILAAKSKAIAAYI